MTSPSRRMLVAAAIGLAALFAQAGGLHAQPIDMSHGGPITVTARDGMDWRQNDQEVVARGDAVAIRDNVTVTADVLIAHYRKKAGANPAAGGAGAPSGGAQPVAAKDGGPINSPPGNSPPGNPPPASAKPAAPPAAGGGAPGSPPGSPSGSPSGSDDSGGNEIYRLDAVGHVHIFTATDQAWGDKGVYDMDQAVLILTGHALKLTTPQDVVTARDSMEYYSQTRISIARGNAVVVTGDGRRIAADTLVSYSEPPDQPASGAPAAPKPPPPPGKPGQPPDELQAASGKLKRVEAYGNVDLRTATEIVYGDRGVYVPDTGKARVIGNVRVTRGDNQVNGVAADVDMKTGVSTMLSSTDQRVHGLIMPTQNENGTAKTDAGKKGAAKKDGKAGETAPASPPAKAVTP